MTSETLQEGVANFRTFQQEASRFFNRAERSEELRKEIDAKRARIHFWWLGLLSAVVVAMFVFLLGKLPNIHISMANPAVQSTQQVPEHSGIDPNQGH